MATASVTLPQQIPHLPVPPIPRVRPPRILKGTRSPNSLPQPPGPAPKGKVWAQGQWRDPASNSARTSRHHRSRQVEKALRHDTHGQNIYAYANIRTNQVVYSLTRVMSNNKILPQLIYHGKKTVPAALRRDNWTPYFSLHFPPNEYGASSGLLAYHQLRELSKQRQLAPPEDMVIATQEDIDRIKARYNPVDLAQALQDKRLTIPHRGQLLPKELRAKKLMNQKTTAVADVAFVLGLQAEGPGPEEAARLKAERRKEWWDNISKGARTRARRRARLREEKDAQLEARKKLAIKSDGSVGLNADAATRIAMEYRRVVAAGGDHIDVMKHELAVEGDNEVVEASATEGQHQDRMETAPPSPDHRRSSSGEVGTKAPMDRPRHQAPPAPRGATEITKAAGGTRDEPKSKVPGAALASTQGPRDPTEVRILWADLRDAAYAQEWPETVVHAELERMAIVKSKITTPQSAREILVTSSRSIHVIGGQKGSGWYLDSNELAALRKASTEGAAADRPKGAPGIAASGSQSEAKHAWRRQDAAAESLRKKGIEVEPPRRSLWGWLRGLVGR